MPADAASRARFPATRRNPAAPTDETGRIKPALTQYVEIWLALVARVLDVVGTAAGADLVDVVVPLLPQPAATNATAGAISIATSFLTEPPSGLCRPPDATPSDVKGG
jgi:hypothetical protein